MELNQKYNAPQSSHVGGNHFRLKSFRNENNGERWFSRCMLGKDLEVITCDLQNEKKRVVQLPHNNANKYIFLCNLEGDVGISRDGNSAKLFSALQGLLLYESKDPKLQFHLNAGTTYKFGLVIVSREYFENHFKNFVNENHSQLFDMDSIAYKSFPYYQVSECVHKLWKSKDNFPSIIITLGYINMIIGLMMKQYLDYQHHSQENRSVLREWEIVQVQKIMRQITEEPGINYSVPSLCRESGLSALKLQEGFKEIHGYTVNTFIREARLQRAEELLRNSDMNISEIVYSIGLCSRSYFSRIFKLKFKCSPSDYPRTNTATAETA